MKKGILLLMLIGSLAFVSSDAFARMGMGPGGMHGPGGRGMFYGDPELMKEKLGLSDDQVDKISKINLDYKKKLLAIREKIEPKQTKLHGILLGDNVNLKDVRTLLEEISALEVDIRMLRINHRLDIEKILTASQKTQLRSTGRRMMRRGDGERPPLDPSE